ncbi:MAG: N-acetyltransferase family protein [Candidatus Thorarchaeota archaeon]|jgi:ribosomal protein S18 acetylase RimI-like enzyme
MRTVREAIDSDRELLVKLFISEVEDNVRLAEAFVSDLLRFRTILCLEGETVIGTLSWETRGGLDDGVVELIGLGVNPECRRQGVAKELVQTLIHDVAKHYSNNDHILRVIYLFMEKGNEGGRAFYKSLGFKEVADVPDLYTHDDAAIWTLHL